MAYISAKCLYCTNEKDITADKTSWLIHLASHRENIIKHLTDTTESCVFCTYPEMFANKKHAASHYRWAHKKSVIVDWGLQQLSGVVVV